MTDMTNDPIASAVRDWLSENHPDATINSLDFDEGDEQWILVLDGITYLAPIGSDDDSIAFYRPDQVQSDEQDGIIIDLDELDLDWENL